MPVWNNNPLKQFTNNQQYESNQDANKPTMSIQHNLIINTTVSAQHTKKQATPIQNQLTNPYKSNTPPTNKQNITNPTNANNTGVQCHFPAPTQALTN